MNDPAASGAKHTMDPIDKSEKPVSAEMPKEVE
jgi:hypothetical protein